MDNFRKQFEAALTAARADRTVGILGYLRAKKALRLWDSPLRDDPNMTVGEAVREYALDCAVSAGYLTLAQAAKPEKVDWQAFLTWFLPLLIAFIEALLDLA